MILRSAVVLGACSVQSLLAQGDTGILEGRVFNEFTGAPLEGARLELRPLGLFARTAFDGSYRFTDLAPGSAVLAVTYTGLDSVEVELALQAGTFSQDIKLTSAIYTSAAAQAYFAARAAYRPPPIRDFPDLSLIDGVRRIEIPRARRFGSARVLVFAVICSVSVTKRSASCWKC